MSVLEIPLSPEPQTFAITLGSVAYVMTVRWNVPAACWVMDLADANNEPILQGVPLVTGADLLEQFEYLNLGGKLVVQTDNSPDAVPTFENLGINGHLYFVVP